MNKIWFSMVIIGMFVAIINGNANIINEVILQDTQEAVVFAIGLVGLMSVWLGLMNIAQKSGLINKIAQITRPVIKKLFPSVPANHPAITAIIMNMITNAFGAGNSATALGIKAMEELQSLNRNKKTATNAMIMFLVINMSSIQLIPLTVIKLRIDTGSISPTEIILTTIIVTTISTTVGIIACKALEG
ncbi:MAG: spore maturation protein [Clostridiales bacterium]|nr:spore maturation protein [Clostridiales bacterium]